MNIELFEFKIKLSEAILEGLPGKEAQYLMAPFKRRQREIESLSSNTTPRVGGVLVYLFPESNSRNLNILLTQRQEYKGVHSGQISFPGGKKEPSDPDILTTALRETKEETGIDVHSTDILFPLTDLYIPPSNFHVYPHLAITEAFPRFSADPKEVRKIIPMTVDQLLSDKIVKSEPMKLFNNMTVDVPYFDVDGHKVWGATAMILSELKQLLLKINSKN